MSKANSAYSFKSSGQRRLTEAKNHDSGLQMGAFPGEAVGSPMQQKG